MSNPNASIAYELDNDHERDCAREVIEAWNANPEDRTHECIAAGALSSNRVADALAELLAKADANCATFESDFQLARAGCRLWQEFINWDIGRTINQGADHD